MSVLLALLATSTTSCTLPPGWSEVEARKTPYVIFGELHGTQQAPAFVSDVVCALARRKERVLLALEIGSAEDADLQAAWRRPADQFTVSAMESIRDWGPEFAGGPMSQATLDMLARLHAEKSKGGRIDVVAFNGARDQAQQARFAAQPGQGPHEAAQAENIRLAADRGGYDKVIVLVGNVHALKQPITRGDAGFEPMAMQLAPPDRVTSLNMTYATGTAFNCQLRADALTLPGRPVSDKDFECRSRPEEGFGEGDGPPAIALDEGAPGISDGQYDGVFWVGPIEAAAPVSGSTKAK